MDQQTEIAAGDRVVEHAPLQIERDRRQQHDGQSQDNGDDLGAAAFLNDVFVERLGY